MAPKECQHWTWPTNKLVFLKNCLFGIASVSIWRSFIFSFVSSQRNRFFSCLSHVYLPEWIVAQPDQETRTLLFFNTSVDISTDDDNNNKKKKKKRRRKRKHPFIFLMARISLKSRYISKSVFNLFFFVFACMALSKPIELFFEILRQNSCMILLFKLMS